jgi:hypothetical protein
VEFTKHEATLHKPGLALLLYLVNALHSLVKRNVREYKHYSFELASKTSVRLHLFKSGSKVFQKAFNLTSRILIGINDTEIKGVLAQRDWDEGTDRAFTTNLRVLLP